MSESFLFCVPLFHSGGCLTDVLVDSIFQGLKHLKYLASYANEKARKKCKFKWKSKNLYLDQKVTCIATISSLPLYLVRSPQSITARKNKGIGMNGMFSISLYLWNYLMAENQPLLKRTVLFVNVSSSLSYRNLGSSGPMLRRLVIHSFLGLRTDSAGGIRLVETINIHVFTQKSTRLELFF
jgi:hypothetical protein